MIRPARGPLQDPAPRDPDRSRGALIRLAGSSLGAGFVLQSPDASRGALVRPARP